MSNIGKNYIYTSLYSIAIMFVTGSIIQTFLLQAGFKENDVYIYNAIVMFSQVIMMAVMIFCSNRIKKIKLYTAISLLSLVLSTIIFLMCAINPNMMSNTYIVLVFIVTAISNIGVGFYNVIAYCLPYKIIDMKFYGKMLSFGVIISGALSFVFSFLYTIIIAKCDYMQTMIWVFIFSIVCFIISSIVCMSLKVINEEENDKAQKSDMLAVLKNKNTYILLVPNFTRGIATGIISVITVIATAKCILNEKTSAYVNIIMQVAMFAGNFIYLFANKKMSSKNILMISTIICCVLFPLCINFGLTGFLIIFLIAYIFRMIIDTTVPVMVAEIIPEEQIGAFTSIRMLVFTGAQAVASLIIIPLESVIGYVGILILSSVMLFIFGIIYYLVALKTKDKQIA